MADLTYLQATLETKIVGQDSTGVTNNYVNADANGNMQVLPVSNGPVTPGTVATKSDLAGGQFNTTLPTLTNTQQSAQQLDSSGRLITITPDITGSGSISANNGSVTATTTGFSTITFNVLGTWSALYQLQATIDGGTNWFGVVGLTQPAGGAYQVFQNNQTITVPCSSFGQVRVNVYSYTSGTLNITWELGRGSEVMQVINSNSDALRTLSSLRDGSDNAITSTLNGAKRGLDVAIVPANRASYVAGTGNFTPPATPTDMCIIIGSATTTIRIYKIFIYTTQTSAGTNQIYLKRYSTADSAGTPTTVTARPLDTNNAAATATIRRYTANPTLGTLVGTMDIAYISAGAVGSSDPLFIWDFTNIEMQPLVLRGTSDQVAVNFNGAALPAGFSIAVSVFFTEE